MPFHPALDPSIGMHFDGCSPSLGIEAIPGNVIINGTFPFHASDPWGFHIRMTKHCKHHIHTMDGIPNIIVDDRPIAATEYPALSCGVPAMSIANNIQLLPL